MSIKFNNPRNILLTVMTTIIAVALLSTSAFGEDDQEHKHQMGMQMKKDGMKMGNKMMREDHSAHGSDSSMHISLSPELKKNMSEMYVKMGECMKTDASIEDCQKKVMVDCPVVKELGYCPLMGGMAQMKEKTK